MTEPILDVFMLRALVNRGRIVEASAQIRARANLDGTMLPADELAELLKLVANEESDSRFPSLRGPAWGQSERRFILERWAADREAARGSSGTDASRHDRRWLFWRQLYIEGTPLVPMVRDPSTDAVVRQSFDPYGVDGPWWQVERRNRPSERRLEGWCGATGGIVEGPRPEGGAALRWRLSPLSGRLLKAGARGILRRLRSGTTTCDVIVWFDVNRRGIVPGPELGWHDTVCVDVAGRFVGYASVPPLEPRDEILDAVASGQLRWVAPGDETLRARDEVDDCPYVGSDGRWVGARPSDLEARVGAPPAADMDHAALVVINTENYGLRVDVSRSPVLIGRAKQCDLQLEGAGVSRFHCSVVRTAEGALVRDLGSKAGTFVNDQRIVHGLLRSGDELKLGRVRLKLRENEWSVCPVVDYRDWKTDGLTGLYNKRHILSDLEASAARRGGKGLAVVLLDLDDFRRVNDTFGHLVGDEMLRAVADALRAALSEEHRLARYGGEEFLVVAEDVTEEEAAAIAEALRRAVSAASFAHADQAIPLSISAGIGLADEPDVTIEGEELLVAAVAALEQAKASRSSAMVRARPRSAPDLPATHLSPVAIAGRVLRMVVELHQRGYPSLAVFPRMAPTGMSWRYTIGVIPQSGEWGPHTLAPVLTRGSLGAQLAWAEPQDDVHTLADKFVAAYGDQLEAARVPNEPNATWYRQTLDVLPPGGAISFASDHNNFDHVEVVGVGIQPKPSISFPPGFRA